VADRITRDHRSWNMSRIRSKNTSSEIVVRSILHRMGYRFRLHSKDLPGTPDLVLPKYKTVIFVNGCFWHRHLNCKYAYIPKTREEFWAAKFQDNVTRDEEVKKQLSNLGWKAITIWECETKDKERLKELINLKLRKVIVPAMLELMKS